MQEKPSLLENSVCRRAIHHEGVRITSDILITMLDAIKQEIQQEVGKIEDDLWNTAVFIHEHPETGLQEFQAVEKLTGLLEQHGFTVEREIAGMKTAFRLAILCVADRPRPLLI